MKGSLVYSASLLLSPAYLHYLSLLLCLIPLSHSLSFSLFVFDLFKVEACVNCIGALEAIKALTLGEVLLLPTSSAA